MASTLPYISREDLDDLENELRTTKPGWSPDIDALQITVLLDLIADFKAGRSELRTHPAAQPAQPVAEKYVEGFLCRAWGETDLPEARLVRSKDEWAAFVAEAQYGAPPFTLSADDADAIAAQARNTALAQAIRAMYLRDTRKRAADLAGSAKDAADLLQHSSQRLTEAHYRTKANKLRAVR